MTDTQPHGRTWTLLVSIGLISLLGACAQQPMLSGDALEAFKTAGPIVPKLDREKLRIALKPTGPHRVSSGDVIEFYMPRVMGTVMEDLVQADERKGTHTARVRSNGTVSVPLIKEPVPIEGLTLQEIEEKLASLYHPKYLKKRPSILSKVADYQTQPVTVLGAVAKPGTYELRKYQMSLVNLLTQAGGILDNRARAVRIRRLEKDGQKKPIVLPVEDTNIEFVDVVLKPGDIVEVVPLNRPLIAVIGLVNAPTTFRKEQNEQISLLQAIGRAGGLNDIADPKYATVYREKANGEIVAARFRVIGEGTVPDGAKIKLKHGDVVAVEHTAMTRTRVLAAAMVRIGIGVAYDPTD